MTWAEVKVAGLISSLKFSVHGAEARAAVDRAVGRGGDDVGTVGVGDGGGRVDDAAGRDLAHEVGIGGRVCRGPRR